MRASDWSELDDWFSAWGLSAEISKRDRSDVLLPGLTAGEFLDFHSRQETPSQARWMPSVTYAHPDRDLSLHIYARRDRTERRPGILFVHGGGWRDGHPFCHIRHAHHFAALGYVTAMVEYRFVTDVPWPAAIDDVNAAVAWLRGHAGELGLDVERLAIAGGSAGAQLAMLSAFQNPGTSRAVVSWYPPTDMRFSDTPTAIRMPLTDLCAFFGVDETGLDAISPDHNVHPGIPPVLTMTGGDDLLTPATMIRRFHEQLTAAGVANELYVFDGLDHAFDGYGEPWAACVAHMERFLATHLGGVSSDMPSPLVVPA